MPLVMVALGDVNVASETLSMGLRTSAEVQRYGGAVPYRASSGTGRCRVSARLWQGFGHRSESLRNGCGIHLGRFLGPGDHSGPISIHFGDFGLESLSEA